MKQIDFKDDPKSHLKKIFLDLLIYSPAKIKAIEKQGVLVFLDSMIKNTSYSIEEERHEHDRGRVQQH